MDLKIIDVRNTFTVDDAAAFGLDTSLFIKIESTEAKRHRLWLTPTTVLVTSSGRVVRAWDGVFDRTRFRELSALVRDMK